MATPDITFIGDIVTYGFSFSPRDFSQCNGAQIAISQNQALFALLGTAFGGNGTTMFALPDLRSRAPAGYYTGGTTYGLVQIGRGMSFGGQSETLSVSNLPAHSHGATFTPAPDDVSGTFTVKSGGAGSPTPTTGDYISGGSGATIYGTGGGIGVTDVEISGLDISGGVTNGTVALANTGSGQAFGTQSPVLAVNFCIAMQGLFPPRN